MEEVKSNFEIGIQEEVEGAGERTNLARYLEEIQMMQVTLVAWAEDLVAMAVTDGDLQYGNLN